MIDLKYLRNEAKSTCLYSSPYMSRKELGELLDMLEAANLDAARHDVMRRNPGWKIDLYHGKYRVSCGTNVLTAWQESHDAAIDAAMAATKGEQA